ncbi:plasmid mobilization protein [Nostoc sp. ChiSLP03a]|nr:ribbon-helix-helix protein, CopG family [Nostoc sp. ChiSLP03a]MDZ8211339.1 ribbon-helix-helix protein, CopG family [Nostoc sp. ChiSLP03a]
MIRTAKVNFRATEQEVAKIKELANAAGYSQSEYIRLAALGFPVQPVNTK